jgi:colicin import membrane protein
MAVVNIHISPDGSIVERRIVQSSGNALYDNAVLLAIDNTHTLEPPPSPDLRDINIEFDSSELNR